MSSEKQMFLKFEYNCGETDEVFSYLVQAITAFLAKDSLKQKHCRCSIHLAGSQTNNAIFALCWKPLLSWITE